MDKPGTLSLVATPIGNLDDISIRAIRTIMTADILLVEDTRVAGKLKNYLHDNYCRKLGITVNSGQRVIPFHEHNEINQAPLVIDYLTRGKNVTLISDAGTPLVSDPGYRLVSESLKRGICAYAVPGANAALSALVVSGLPVHSFAFHGYPPEKPGKQEALFKIIKTDRVNHTHIFYLSPHKIKGTLKSMLSVFGDITVVILRELTKIHEERLETKISDLIAKSHTLKGELVMLFVI